MEKVKTLISRLLSSLADNIQRTGDPLGIKKIYWTDWADSLDLSRTGEATLLTGRMYQMLPYITQAVTLLSQTEKILSRKILGNIVSRGSKLAGEKALTWGAKKEEDLAAKGARSLRGIVKVLSAIGLHPAYLYEEEPYSGVMLYDLGLDDTLAEYIDKVYRLLKDHGIKEVICVDPHTALMLKKVYPQYISGYDLKVRHYLEILDEKLPEIEKNRQRKIEEKFVMHDSCVMARDLSIVEPQRKLLKAIGAQVLEPEHAKLDTLCCGGPIEYAFLDLAGKVSRNRIENLSEISTHIALTCPICLLNLSRYEQEFGIKVSDVGEILDMAL